MYRTLLLLVVGSVAVVRATVPTSFAAHMFPASNLHFGIDYPEVARCPDGAVWSVWGQGGQSHYYLRKTIAEREGDPDVGLFCRCLGADGTDIVPPRRIDMPVLDYMFHIPYTSGLCVSEARPDGGLVVFYVNLRNSTSVISVDRKGRVNRAAFDDYFEGAHAKRGEPLTAAFWSWYDSAGDLQCLYHQTWRLVRYATLRFHDSRVEQRAPSGLYYPAESAKDSARFVRTTTLTAACRQHLGWTDGGWDYADVAPLAHDTLLVAYAVPIKKGYESPWGRQLPSDTLIIYRLRAYDLILIDSVRTDARDVAGSDYDGDRVSRALLQKTAEGYSFVIACPSGSRSYQLDAHGAPVYGNRDTARLAASDAYDGTGKQVMTVLQPDGILRHRQVHWFGLTSSGILCHEMAEP